MMCQMQLSGSSTVTTEPNIVTVFSVDPAWKVPLHEESAQQREET